MLNTLIFKHAVIALALAFAGGVEGVCALVELVNKSGLNDFGLLRGSGSSYRGR